MFDAFVSQVWCFVCLFVCFKPKKGAVDVFITLSVLLLSLRTPLGEKKETARDSPTDMDHRIPEVSAFELEIVLSIFSSQYSFSWDFYLLTMTILILDEY